MKDTNLLDQIEQLLTELERDSQAKRYTLIVDLLWFIYRLFKDPSIDTQPTWVDRLYVKRKQSNEEHTIT